MSGVALARCPAQSLIYLGKEATCQTVVFCRTPRQTYGMAVMDKGFIYLSRDLFDRDSWLSEPFTRSQAWIDLIQLASWKKSMFYIRGNKIDIKRGQLGHSILTLADRWKWSRGKVSRFLDELEIEQQIVQQKTRLTTLIYIVNYEKYQTKRTIDDTTDGQQTGNRRTTDGQQTDTLEEVKEVKAFKEVNNKTTLAQSEKIAFDWNSFEFVNLDGKTKLFQDKFPAIDVKQELLGMEAWLMANPKNRKSNYERFIISWLKRAQDSARPQKETDEDRRARELQEMKVRYNQA